jgi:hypothetical protein
MWIFRGNEKRALISAGATGDADIQEKLEFAIFMPQFVEFRECHLLPIRWQIEVLTVPFTRKGESHTLHVFLPCGVQAVFLARVS